eukprot:SAG22_NODE_6370_length_865_cov_0.966057_1_plen_283_part_01
MEGETMVLQEPTGGGRGSGAEPGCARTASWRGAAAGASVDLGPGGSVHVPVPVHAQTQNCRGAGAAAGACQWPCTRPRDHTDGGHDLLCITQKTARMALQALVVFGLAWLQAEAAESTTSEAQLLQQPSICLNETGFAFVSAAGCRSGATPFRHTGADAFNILWSVWSPTQAPHPPHIGNWSTSAATLEQMAAAKLPFARVFGSPWGWQQIALWRSDTEQYWANMTRVVDKAKAVGARLHLSITPTLSQFAIAAGCPSTRELITNEGGSGCRDVLKGYVQDMV